MTNKNEITIGSILLLKQGKGSYEKDREAFLIRIVSINTTGKKPNLQVSGIQYKLIAERSKRINPERFIYRKDSEMNVMQVFANLQVWLDKFQAKILS